VVYNTENYWVFGLCPSSGILKTRKTQGFGNWTCFLPQVRDGETPTLLGPLERAGEKTETDPVSETLCSLVLRIPYEWTKSKNPVILNSYTV
jgi:hypothetical protein